MDLRMRQTRTVRDKGRVTAKCEDAWPLALVMVEGLSTSPPSPLSALTRQKGNHPH